MSKKSIEGRLTIVERQLVLARGVLKEIYLQTGTEIAVRAKIVSGQSFEGEPGEDFEAFRIRVRAIAEAERADVVVFGGFPENPPEWATPPGMDEALTRADWAKDEIDFDPDQPE